MLQVLGLLIPRGTFQVLLLSARQLCMTRILIFPIFMTIPEYLDTPLALATEREPEGFLRDIG